MSKTNLLSIDHNGEIIYHSLNSHINKKYKPDTALDKPFVPYLVMLLCGATDFVFFYNLFKMISYDNPILLGFQVVALLFGADVVPVYLGIMYRRIKQGLCRDKSTAWLALIACVLTFIINIVLRLLTMDQMSPNLSSATTSFIGSVSQGLQKSEAAGVDPTALGLALTGIVVPFVTSIGSFFISSLSYNPLLVRKRRDEEMLAEKKDEIRRLKALLSEYDADPEFANHLIQNDKGEFEEMKKAQRVLVLSYCDYARQRIMEHLATPTAISALSEETCVAIMDRLDREVAALDMEEIPYVHVDSCSKETKPASNEAAA